MEIESIEGLNVETAATQAGFADVGNVVMSPEESWAEFGAAFLVSVLKPFVARRSAAFAGIVGKSILLSKVPDRDDVIRCLAYDGGSYLNAIIPAKVNRFPDNIIVDLESLYRVAQNQVKNFFLIYKHGALYADFCGGEVFISTYQVEPSMFQYTETAAVAREKEVSPEQYYMAMSCLKPIVDSAINPEYAFIFSMSDGMFATNGTSVSKVEGDFFPITMRHRDIDVVSLILELGFKGKVLLQDFDSDDKKYYKITARGETGVPSFEYMFPKTQAKLSEEFISAVSRPENFFMVDTKFLARVTDLFSNMPEMVGVFQFEFSKEFLKCETFTRRGNKSNFVLSKSSNGELSKAKAAVPVKNLVTALRVFRDENNICLAVGDRGMQVFAGNKYQTVFVNE